MLHKGTSVLICWILLEAVFATPGHYCSSPVVPGNGGIVGGARSIYHVGDYIEYVCDEGLLLQGSRVATCIYGNGEGKWNTPHPLCRRIVIYCEDLPFPKNGAVVQTGTEVGDKAYYGCDQGFTLEGDITRECLESGVWSGNEPKCIELLCEKLYNPLHGLVRVKSRMAGSRVVYECISGYVLLGEEYRTCLLNGTWSGDEPKCKFVVCDNLQHPEFGRVSTSGTVFGSRARYRCFASFILLGEENRMCQENGCWSGQAPTCIFKGCNYLDSPLNGNVTISGTAMGSIATYTCNSGFQLIGKHNVRYCTRNGEWSGQAPTCEQILLCEELSDPLLGSVIITGRTPGSRATYQCDAGTNLMGNETRTCQSNGNWTGTQPRCLFATCPSLQNPENGHVQVTGNSLGAIAFYRCNRDFVLIGRRRRLCQTDGTWSSEEPNCTPITCDELSDPQNGTVTLTGTVIGSQATYVCKNKFTLVEDSARECQSNGEWSGQAPTCEFTDCGSLKDPENGRVILSGTFRGSTTNYSCKEGYTLVGNNTRTCQRDATWSGNAPACIAVDCGVLENPKNGRVDSTTSTLSSTANYSCNEGFVLIGEDTRVCQSTGQWSGKQPICRAINCGSLSAPQYGHVSLSGTMFRSEATYICNKGFLLVGVNSRICHANDSWSGHAPNCRRIAAQCGLLRVPGNGFVHVECSVVGCYATYQCRNYYYLSGNKKRVCQSNGEWSSQTPQCFPNYKYH